MDAKQLITAAKEYEANNQYMAASSFYRDAAALFKQLGDKTMLNFTKGKIIEMNKLAMQYEYKKHSSSITIDDERMREHENFINDTLELTLDQILDLVGKSHRFYPCYSDVLKDAAETMPIAMNIASISATDPQGNVIKGSFDGKLVWKSQMYHLDILIKYKISVVPLFTKLIDNGKINDELLLGYLNRNNICSENNLLFIKDAIKAFFQNDFVKTIHLLIPQIEAIVLEISKQLDLDTVKAIRDSLGFSTERQNLSEGLIDSKNFRNLWDENFCEFLSFVLFRPLGYKFRHKLAHGLLTYEECHFSNCLMIIHLFICLSDRTALKQSFKTEEST